MNATLTARLSFTVQLPSCIDLILTNSPYSFQNFCVIETGLSNFQKVISYKNYILKLKPRIVRYRDYTEFSNDNFRKKLLENLYLGNINTNSNGLEKFDQICINTLDQMPPRKKNTDVAIMCHFSIKNYLVKTKKKATKKSFSQKKILSK